MPPPKACLPAGVLFPAPPLPACLLLPRLPPGMWMDAPEHPIVSLSRSRRVGALGDFLSGVRLSLVPAGVLPPLCSSTYPYLPCLSPSARGQGFESPTHRQQTGEEISGDKKQETRQFTTASFFVSPHRMAVRMGKGEADKGTSASIRVRCRNVRVSRQPACRAKPEPGMKLSGRLRRIYKRANTIPHEIRFR